VADAPGKLLAYSIVRRGYPAFDGSGAARWGGRWTRAGRAVIHAAETYSLAVLENLVHFNLGELPLPLPLRLVVVQIRIPPEVSREVLAAADLPGWDGPQPNAISQEFGDRWYDERRTCVLLVPSRLSPFERNVLIHGDHPDRGSITVAEPQPAHLDERLQQRLCPR
jgi:RES domain-containing protein